MATVLLVYLVFIAIVLLNLLIAVLSTSRSKVQEHADQECRVLRSRLIKHYRTVVREDLLSAPFSLVQLPVRRSEILRRYPGYPVFSIVIGPAAVVGGARLWVVSAFLVPSPRSPATRGFTVTTRSEYYTTDGFRLGIEYVVLFLRRVLRCSLHLLTWWLTRSLVCAWIFASGGC